MGHTWKIQQENRKLLLISLKFLNESVDRFHSYSALKHIIVTKIYSLNLIKLSLILTNTNGLKSAANSKITIPGLTGRGEGPDRLY